MDYSIIICTYNTDYRILNRCLKAVRNLDREGLETEVILADNNSEVPVEKIDFVAKCFSGIPNFSCLFVAQQGVKYARIAAIEKARGNYIIYIDADNEPERDYLQRLKILNRDYKNVGAWGPGNVTVEFMDGISPSLQSYASYAFQERHNTTVEMASEKEWQSCYPYGTGLCMIASVLREYVALTKKGLFTFEGRKGKALSSGEDTQMIMLSIKKGYYAGVAPELRLNHLIPANRANNSYLKRLAFGTAFCYEPSMLQLFSERQKLLNEKMISSFAFSKKAFKKLIRSKFAPQQKFYDAINFIGWQSGIFMAVDKPLPPFIRIMIKILKLK